MSQIAAIVETRTLPPDEWPRLVGTELETLWPKLRSQTDRVLVVERDGEIIACWALMQIMHVEGFWIAPAERKKPGIVRRLVLGMRELAREYGVSSVWTGSETEDLEAMIVKAGGVRVPFASWVLPVGEED